MKRSLPEPSLHFCLFCLLFIGLLLTILEAAWILPVLIATGCLIYYASSEKIKAFINTSSTESDDDPLAIVRGQYARGELTEAGFERKVDQLLETETVEEVKDYSDREPITERT